MANTRMIITVLAIASSATISGCGTGEASLPDASTLQAESPVPVEVAQPYRMDLYASYVASATMASDADAPAVARVAGDVVEMLVEEGDFVEAGQVLARLDGERLRLEMLAAKANLDQARREHARYADLHARGLVSASAYDQLQFDLEALEANYDLKKLNYDYTSIRAPISGVVASREIRPGQNVAASAVAFRITDTRELLAYLQIPQSELAKISAGDPATIRVAAIPDTDFPANIVRISPTIDTRNGTFRATAVIDNAHGKLAPGMFARITIGYEQHQDALVIPSDALLNDEDEATVYVVSDGQVQRRVVETGINTEGFVEILGGLDEAEMVVVVGQSALRDGSRVLASNNNLERHTG